MADIVKLDFGKPRRLHPKKSDKFCNHLALEVIEHTRTVQCKKCKAVLDAFDVLWKSATKQKNYLDWKGHYKAEEIKAREELEEVKRELRNAKARLQRARKAG